MPFTPAALVSLLITLVIFAIIVFVVKIILDAITLPPTAKMIAYALVGLVFFLWLLKALNLY